MSIGVTQYTSWEDPSCEDLLQQYLRIAQGLLNSVRAEYGDSLNMTITTFDKYVVVQWGHFAQAWVGEYDPEAPYTVLETVNDFLVWRGSEWRLRADLEDDPYRIDIRLYPGSQRGRELA